MARYALHPQVCLRQESFGALAYHYGNRRLTLLRAPELVSLVQGIDRFASARAAYDGVGIDDLFHMGSLSLTFDPANVKNVVLPVGAGGGSNLVKTGDADGLLADFADDGVLQSH